MALNIDLLLSTLLHMDGIFKDSLIGQKFIKKKINLPEWELLSFEGVDLSYIYVLVEDETFPLTEYLIRPYSGKK